MVATLQFVNINLNKEMGHALSAIHGGFSDEGAKDEEGLLVDK